MNQVNKHTTDLQITERQLEVRNAISTYEQDLKQRIADNTGVITTHHFAGGCYSREMFLPVGISVVGKIHRYEYLNILQKGKIALITEDGSRVIQAPYTWVGRSGTKVTAIALEDAVWCNISRTDTTNLDDIEKHEIAPSFEQLEKEWNEGIVPRPQVSTEEFIPYKDLDGAWMINENLKITVEGVDATNISGLIDNTLQGGDL